MGENVFSASLLMKKLGGANDTVLPAGRNKPCTSTRWRQLPEEQLSRGGPGDPRGHENHPAVCTWQTRAPWAAIDKAVPTGQGRLTFPSLQHW